MNYRRFFSLALAGVMAASLLTGCNSDSSAGAGDATTQGSDAANTAAEDVSARTSLTVGFDAEFPPYGYQDENGEYIGFDLDLAQEVCDRRGWELIKKPIDWDSKDLELTSGSIDCIWNGFTMNGREDSYTWSKPYVDNSQIIVTTADSGIAALTDLAGKNVAVQADSSALAALEDEETPENVELAESFNELMQVADYNTGFMNLESGAVDAIAMDIGVATYQIAQRDAEKFVILDEELAAEQYAVGFALGNTTLRDAVQETLEEMVEDGAVDEIVSKWSEMGLSAESVILGKE